MFSLSGIGKKYQSGHRGIFAILLVAILWMPASGQKETEMPDPRMPMRAIDSLTDSNRLDHGEQILLRGILTFSSNDRFPDQRLFIQDRTGAIEVATKDATQFGVGDEVEVQGAVIQGRVPLLFRAEHIRLLWTGSDAIPLALHTAQAVEGDFNARLIEVQGKLLQQSISDGTLTLALEEENQFFVAKLAVGDLNTKASFPGLEPGAILDLRGICSTPPAGQISASALTILLRSLGDIRTIRPAPWFNMAHLLELSPVLLLIVLLLHRLHVRNLNLRFRAVMTERSRIARELHDTMAQDFSGVTLQLEGAVEALRTQSPSANSLEDLSMALRIARHCREEAHDSIIVLRALGFPGSSLLETLTQAANNKTYGRNLRVQSTCCGTPYPIRDEVTHQILRIGQEAIANILHHAGASLVVLILDYAESGMVLQVQDNGKGFNTNEIVSASEGHFGITGMQERAASIGAVFRLESTPGHGTIVTLHVPCRVACASGKPWRRISAGSAFGTLINSLKSRI